MFLGLLPASELRLTLLSKSLSRLAELRGVTIEQAPKSILVGDAPAIRQQIQAYINAGVAHVIINLRRPGLYGREGVRVFAKEVMPGFGRK